MQCRTVYLLVVVLAACSQPTKTDPETSEENKVAEVPQNVQTALQRNTCLACHKTDRKLIGPSYMDIANKMNSTDEIISLIRTPVPSHWPEYPAMIGVSINDADGKAIGDWIMSLKTNKP